MESYEQFWPFYMREHSDPVCRALHFTGTTLALIALAAGAIVAPAWFCAVPVAGYLFAWIGHFVFEKNRPATFKHPLWSLRADFRMYRYMWTRRMPAEISRAAQCLALAVIVAASLHAAPDLARLPLSFEPNRGQAPVSARFLAHGHGYTLTAEPAALRFQSRAGSLRMRFLGARPSVIEPEAPLDGKANYLRTNDRSRWRTDIPTYSRIRYRNLYPGIDLVCRGGASDFEYDFVLSPGARASAIRLDFPDAARVGIDESGGLVLATGGRAMRQRPPRIYQEIGGVEKPVAGRFVRRGRRAIGFELAAYDRTRPVVIDPTLVYSTYIAYSGADTGSAIAVDAAGNAYIAGVTIDPNYGDQDFLIVEVDPTGAKVINYVAFGGSYDDTATALAVDSLGNVYITGGTQSPDLPIAGTSFQQHIHGGENAYLAVLKPDFKNLVFSTYLGGSTADQAFAIALDASRNIFIAGGTESNDFPTGSSSYQRRFNGGTLDAFLAKFSATGSALFSTYFGAGGNEIAYGVATDSAGNVYITGSTTSPNLPTTGGVFQSSNAGSTDAFVAKFTNTGAIVYSTYFGGSSDDFGQAIAVDSSGNAFVTGSTSSTNLPTTATGVQPASGGGQDAFVVKLNSAGSSLAWSTYLGGTGDEGANAIALDSGGGVYVTGQSDSADFPLTGDAYQNTVGLKAAAFVTQISSNGGSLVYSTLIGGSAGDQATSIAVSCTTGIFIAGTTVSGDFPVTMGVVGSQFAGQQDGFLARFAGAGGPPAINANGVTNGADFTAGPVAPGSLIVIKGSNFSGSTPANASAAPWPATLGGATLTANGVNAPLSAVSAGQITAQLPWETQPGQTQIIVNGCGLSSPLSINVAASAPAIFQDAGGRATGVTNADGSTNDSGHPAQAGTAITVSLTGIGSVTNQPATGAAASASQPSMATLSYSATIGGQQAPTQSLALTPGSVTNAQTTVMVPALASGDYPLVISVGGVASAPATISVAGN